MFASRSIRASVFRALPEGVRSLLIMSMFSQKKLRELILLYQNHPIIWDPQNKDYFSREMKDDAWRDISDKSGYPVDDIRKKLNSMLGSYRREKSRQRRSLTSGENVYKSKWFAFKWFRFMNNKNTPQHLRNKFKEVSNSQNPTENTSTVCVKQEPIETCDVEPPLRTRSNSKRDRTEVKYDVLSPAPVDHYSSFGNYVSSELRKYDSRTVTYVKKAICDILFKADLSHICSQSMTDLYNESDSSDNDGDLTPE